MIFKVGQPILSLRKQLKKSQDKTRELALELQKTRVETKALKHQLAEVDVSVEMPGYSHSLRYYYPNANAKARYYHFCRLIEMHNQTGKIRWRTKVVTRPDGSLAVQLMAPTKGHNRLCGLADARENPLLSDPANYFNWWWTSKTAAERKVIRDNFRYIFKLPKDWDGIVSTDDYGEFRH